MGMGTEIDLQKQIAVLHLIPKMLYLLPAPVQLFSLCEELQATISDGVVQFGGRTG